ncbi:MAG: complex I NDUFA9 subunit family protein [Pseudomonadota bacterium]|nr:complex I NDUFA9 subunit family protein [Pseudomonadota bacterium]
MKKRDICILGGTGFVGHHLAQVLCNRGHRVKIFSRHPQRHRDLNVLPNAKVVAAELNDESALAQAFSGSDVVINLIGILNERGHDGSGFRLAHVELPARLSRAAAKAGVKQFLHMSALGADSARGSSDYLRSKGEGEQQVRLNAGDRTAVTIFRPSVIFGPGDAFINRFAGMLRLIPFAFPLPTPDTRMAPVYVGDVVTAMADCIDRRDTHDQRFSLCGPKIYTLKQILQFTAETASVKRWIIGLPPALSRLQATILEYVPGKPYSLDNYRSSQVDSVCEDNHLVSFFQRQPAAIETVIPSYLGQTSSRGRFANLVRQTRHEFGQHRETGQS